jgi:hypothetical protein
VSTEPTLALTVERRDSHLTEFTSEEHYVLRRGMEILARASPSASGDWKVSWFSHTRHFETKEQAVTWLNTHPSEITAPAFYPR